MTTLETTRVCIIDDEPKEYLPLIHAVSRLRFGCIHVAGDKIEDLPAKPFEGLRLIFLDMQLGSEGSDDASVTSHTAQVFSRIVPPNAGPLLVVIWTKYSDIVEMFQERLYEHYPEYRGKLLFARLEKPANADEIEVNKLREEISLALRNYYPAEILWRWEQLAHDAASATTEGISKHATNRAGFDPEDTEEVRTAKLLKGISSVLRILISAEAEQTISVETAFRDLLSVLNPLHYDRLEHGVELEDSKAGEDLVKGEHVYATPSEKLELNTMLLVAQYNIGGALFRPGVIFGINDDAGFERRFRIAIAEVFTEMLDGPKNAELNKFCKKLERTDLDENRRAVFLARVGEEEANVRQARDAWFARCVPILVDISASCDFAQDNPRLARLMMGLMVPEDSEIEYHRTGAFRELPTIKIPGYGDVGWDLVFCSRFVFSVSPKAPAEEIKPICRLRESIIADLRGWAAAQDARGGHVSVK